jgi:hypothetical protein
MSHIASLKLVNYFTGYRYSLQKKIAVAGRADRKLFFKLKYLG